jgi:hypothetical protein
MRSFALAAASEAEEVEDSACAGAASDVNVDDEGTSWAAEGSGSGGFVFSCSFASAIARVLRFFAGGILIFA